MTHPLVVPPLLSPASALPEAAPVDPPLPSPPEDGPDVAPPLEPIDGVAPVPVLPPALGLLEELEAPQAAIAVAALNRDAQAKARRT